MFKRSIVIELSSPTPIDLEQEAENANYSTLDYINELYLKEIRNSPIKVKINWGKWIKGE